ncbi:MAG: hypothetical protein WBR26_07860 [Candidatus Acidiferrum sp.]
MKLSSVDATWGMGASPTGTRGVLRTMPDATGVALTCAAWHNPQAASSWLLVCSWGVTWSRKTRHSDASANAIDLVSRRPDSRPNRCIFALSKV